MSQASPTGKGGRGTPGDAASTIGWCFVCRRDGVVLTQIRQSTGHLVMACADEYDCADAFAKLFRTKPRRAPKAKRWPIWSVSQSTTMCSICGWTGAHSNVCPFGPEPTRSKERQ